MTRFGLISASHQSIHGSSWIYSAFFLYNGLTVMVAYCVVLCSHCLCCLFSLHLFFSMTKVIFNQHIISLFEIKFLIENKLIICALGNLHYKILREKFEPEPGFEPRTSGFLARTAW